MRSQIKKLVSGIKTYDSLESEHISNTLQWLKTDVEIFRIKKPDIPPKHLVSYFVLVDQKKKKLLLMHHRKAGLLLPAGGHVEKDEHPNQTVEREMQEELGLTASFISELPLFVTQ